MPGSQSVALHRHPKSKNRCVRFLRKLKPSTLYFVGTVALSLCTTALYMIIITRNDWTYVTYDTSKLLRMLNSTQPKCQVTRTANGIILWTDNVVDPISGNCSRGNTGVLLHPERSGVWQYCKDVSEKEWTRIRSFCSGTLKSSCLNFLDGFDFCCKKCYQRKPSHFTVNVDAGLTVQAAAKTTMSTIIVSIMLQCAGYLQVLFAMICGRRHLTVAAMMTGVTFLLSAMFVSFALIVAQYKTDVIMNVRTKTLYPMPRIVRENRTAQAGPGIYVGWVVVILFIGTSMAWLQLSSHLANMTVRIDQQNIQTSATNGEIRRHQQHRRSRRSIAHSIF